MRELNVNEIESVNGGNFFFDWLKGKSLDAALGYAWDNRESAGKWAYNGGSHRRSLY